MKEENKQNIREAAGTDEEIVKALSYLARRFDIEPCDIKAIPAPNFIKLRFMTPAVQWDFYYNEDGTWQAVTDSLNGTKKETV